MTARTKSWQPGAISDDGRRRRSSSGGWNAAAGHRLSAVRLLCHALLRLLPPGLVDSVMRRFDVEVPETTRAGGAVSVRTRPELGCRGLLGRGDGAAGRGRSPATILQPWIVRATRDAAGPAAGLPRAAREAARRGFRAHAGIGLRAALSGVRRDGLRRRAANRPPSRRCARSSRAIRSAHRASCCRRRDSRRARRSTISSRPSCRRDTT